MGSSNRGVLCSCIFPTLWVLVEMPLDVQWAPVYLGAPGYLSVLAYLFLGVSLLSCV